MNRIFRFFARISIRILAFNLLLVFLPVAGVLYLGTYEQHLTEAQQRAMVEQGKIFAAALSGGTSLDRDAAQAMIARTEAASLGRAPDPYSARVRIVDPSGHVVADSYWLRSRESVVRSRGGRIRKSRLYKVGAFLMRPIARAFRPPDAALETDDVYETSSRLNGPEVAAALSGHQGSSRRLSTRSPAVTLYEALPLRGAAGVTGAVLLSQSTYPILRDVYAVRIGILRIFVVSLALASILSAIVAMTIVRPLRQLRLETREILDRRGRLKGHFRGSKKLDEIGDLSRALERLTKRVEEHVRFIESFASDVSHEFKNPLAAIRAATEMLADIDEPEQRQKFRRMIENDVARLEGLLSGVRDITLIDAQLSREQREDVDVVALLEAVIESFRLRQPDLVFVYQHSVASALVSASSTRLMQVFTNLLDNAASFSPERGSVTTKITVRGPNVLISVADQGPGIPAAHRSRIFDRFFSYRPKSSRHEAHSGLGLAIVKTIVEGYGGTISVTSGENEGAALEVALPLIRRS
jgi:two-component system sensor histidine kinase ChvG